MAEPPDVSWLAPVLVHVQTHLDEDLGLEPLADLAGYSAQHFQRRFAESVGLSPHQYVERLRMERAGHLLFITDDSAAEIAASVGYSRYETFSRAFSRRFGSSPRKYRTSPVRLDLPGYEPEPPVQLDIVSMSSVRIEQRRAVPLAFIRNLGDYFQVDASLYDRLDDWRAKRWPGEARGTLMGIGHDDPGVTAAADLRFDACVTVPEEFHPTDGISCQLFPAGTYAAITYHGPVGEPMMAAYAQLYSYAMDSRRYKLLGLPVVEVYNTTRVTEWTSVKTTEILVPVTLS